MIVGLTGGIGSGKTTVSNMFAELGIEIVDTDVIAREVVAVGEPALEAIGEHFGNDILLDDGNLDRKLLREKIFADDGERIWLQNLLHPIIRQHTRASLGAASSPYVILSSPLLIESPDAELVDKIIVVDIPESSQIERTVARDDVTKEQVSKTINAQLDAQSRVAKADFIIDNSGSLQETLRQVESLHQTLLEAC